MSISNSGRNQLQIVKEKQIDTNNCLSELQNLDIPFFKNCKISLSTIDEKTITSDYIPRINFSTQKELKEQMERNSILVLDNYMPDTYNFIFISDNSLVFKNWYSFYNVNINDIKLIETDFEDQHHNYYYFSLIVSYNDNSKNKFIFHLDKTMIVNNKVYKFEYSGSKLSIYFNNFLSKIFIENKIKKQYSTI